MPKAHLGGINYLGGIQVLRNADGGGGGPNFLEKSITKV